MMRENDAKLSSTRRAFGGAAALVGLSALIPKSAIAAAAAMQDQSHISMEIYKGFALQEFDRWNGIIHPDVKSNSPAGRDIVGLQTLKDWNKAFHTAFRPRVDLVDHYVVGNRGLVTVNLHWKHDGGPFNGIAPTGKSGTSVESFLLRLENGQVIQWDVADNSLDLAMYLHDQGFPLPTFVTPPALIKG
jgi:hypothetical protein